jgi:hypothetical protein
MTCETCPKEAVHFYLWRNDRYDLSPVVHVKCEHHYQFTRDIHRFDHHLMVDLTKEEVKCYEVLES